MEEGKLEARERQEVWEAKAGGCGEAWGHAWVPAAPPSEAQPSTPGSQSLEAMVKRIPSVWPQWEEGC